MDLLQSSRHWSHREYLISHEESSWTDAGPYASFAQRATHRYTVRLDKDKEGELKIIASHVSGGVTALLL